MSLKKHPRVRGYSATFWHFITEGTVPEPQREPVEERCERIRWPRPIIDAVDSQRVRCWTNTRKGRLRILLALPDFSYLVVLADRGDYVLPWTAYPVTQLHRQRKLRREWEASR